jgi:hypothetical protein
MEIIPIEALFDELKGVKQRSVMVRAEVIIGVDRATQRQFTVFGTPSLEETVTLGGTQALSTVRIDLDTQNGDLEKLAALVQVLKGRADFLGADDG